MEVHYGKSAQNLKSPDMRARARVCTPISPACVHVRARAEKKNVKKFVKTFAKHFVKHFVKTFAKHFVKHFAKPILPSKYV